MIGFVDVIFWSAALLLIGTYLWYPVSLGLLAWLAKPRDCGTETMRPVTLMISAYNEEAVIREKLDNCLRLDYPRDRLDIVVVSDASSDGTDAIVAEYGDRGVVLCRQEPRRGKSAGLTRFVPHARGEIIVFSDANSLYEPDAITKLVRHFADPSVGYVVGQQRYREDNSAASQSESLYWRYETWIKKLESRVDSVVGGDGAIFAIRRELFEPLREDDINDFLIPLRIVARGYRGVFAPEAVCYERTAGSFHGEFRRKVRIVNRSMRAVLRVPQTLNPFRVGVFAYQLALHKVVRWFVPFFLLMLLLASGLGAIYGRATYQVALGAESAFCALAALGAVPGLRKRKPVYIAFYFCIVNAAAGLGILSMLFGRRFATWTPQREQDKQTGMASQLILHALTHRVLPFFLLATLVVGGLWAVRGQTIGQVSPRFPLVMFKAAFWTTVLLLGYVYVLFPVLMTILACRRQRGGMTDDRETGELPFISLIVPACNEETVLREKLDNAIMIEYPQDRLDIIIASDGSRDRTVEIAARFEDRGVRVLQFTEQRGKASVLNDAAIAASGDVLCLCDANVMFRPDALRRMAGHLEDAGVGAVSGDVRLASSHSNFGVGEMLFYRLERVVQTGESRKGSMMGVDGGMYVVRKELFPLLPPDTILDDFVVTMNVIRQGKRVVYEPSAVATENATLLARQEFRRRVRVSAGAVQSLKRRQWPPLRRPVELWQYVSHKLLRWLGPVWLGMLLVASCQLSVVSCQSSGVADQRSGGEVAEAWVYRAAFVGQAVLYLTAVAATFSLRLRATRIGGVAFYFVMSHVAMAIGLAKGLFNWQRVTWQRTERGQGGRGQEAGDRGRRSEGRRQDLTVSNDR